ncbi:Hsp20/alpha crystallin family protein [Dactylosporangium sp. NPDC049140]|uniref:Hsp20/alpha crystallin family protein n=1 Tax=Dactylosporangium sp. NPDC049140 TaxID=3155647 RepID=UPI0033E1C329
MTLLVTRPRRSLAMYPALGLPVTSGAPVDIEETSAAFRIELDLPGVAPGDVEIELRDSELRVYGSFKERERTGTLRHHARRTGEFEYLLSLPGDVDADAVEADLDGGVLTIVAPKLREQHARRIAIQGGRDTGPAMRPDAPDTPAAHAKQMKEGQARPGTGGQPAGIAGKTSTGTGGVGSTGQVGRSATA